MTGFDQSQSPRLGQRTSVDTTTVTMFTGAELPEASWDGRMIYRPDRQTLQVYRAFTGAFEDVTGGEVGLLTFVGTEPPIALHVGDIWFNSAMGNALYLAMTIGANEITSGEWELQQDSATAQSTADQKNKVFYQEEPPLITDDRPLQINDVWVDINNNNQVRIWNGTAWTDTKLGTGALDTDSITMNALSVLGNLDVRGVNNFLNGQFQLSNGVTDPKQLPTVTSSYAKTSGHEYGTQRRGLGDAGANWVFTENFGTISSYLYRIPKIGGTTVEIANFAQGSVVWMGLGGCTVVGSTIYVLVTSTTSGSTPWARGNWYIFKYTFTGTYLGFIDTTFTTGDGLPMIGNDGTDLLISWSNSLGDAFIYRYTTAGVFTGQLNFSDTWGQGNFCGLIQSSTGLSTTRYLIARYNAIQVWSFTTANQRFTAEEWPKAPGDIVGITQSGGNYWQFDGRDFTRYEPTNQGTWDFAYSWYDSDPLPGVADFAESKPSPKRTVAPTKFARWTINLPVAPPDNGSPDDPNTARLYAAPTGNTLVRQATLAVGSYSLTFDSLLTTGTPPLIVSEFSLRASTAFGRIFTAGLNALLTPTFEVLGSGQGRAGWAAWNDDGTNANDSGWIPITLAAGFKQFVGSASVPAVRKIDGKIRLRGGISPNSGNFAINSNIDIGTLPVGYRPLAAAYYQIPGGGATTPCRLVIPGSIGTLTINTGPTATSTAILDSVEFWL